MVSASLVPHPQTPCPLVRAINVRVSRPSDALLTAQFMLTGDVAGIAFPAAMTAERADGLWRHTCCELFVRRADSTNYFEFNLSPSLSWAAYAFASYRHDMAAVALDRDPTIATELGDQTWRLDAELHLPGELARAAPNELAIASTMVVETTATALSYWALIHAAGPPDFHHASGFTLRL
jgi:hypothetical protein